MVEWPRGLFLIRHGESEGNLANARAREMSALRVDLTCNDIDVDLSRLGRQQAAAVGRWFGALAPTQQPTAAWVSPYRRARQTADVLLQTAGLTIPVSIDERLRDREQGTLDLLTAAGIKDRFPAEAERRAFLGKFWYRPPGGESWADVAARLRTWLLELRLTSADDRILVVTHDVPLILTRYIIEQLSADQAVALAGQVANCSVTDYRATATGMALSHFNETAALERDNNAVVTAHE
jgi:probable phosphoglycerate mutase